MAHFYSVITKSARKQQPSATGRKDTGLEVLAASWEGAIRVELFHKDGADHYRVTRRTWPEDKGVAILAEGRLDGQ